VKAVVKSESAPGFQVREVPRPAAGPGEVLLRVETASVCGTDIHLYDWNPWAASRVRPPRVMGHEMCGIVESVGENVAVATGTRVAVESHIVCGRCSECLRGDAHVCANTRILGVDIDGVFASHVVVPEANLWPVDAVAVLGCGPIGCAAVAVARLQGAARVIAADLNPYRLELAQQLGAQALVRAGDSLEDDLRRAAGGDIDCVLEMSGAEPAVLAAIRAVRPGGWVSLLGLGDGRVSLDLSTDVVMRGITLHGIVGRRLPQDWQLTIDYLTRGQIDASVLLTHRFALDEIEEAIALMKSGRCGKVALLPG
jgi:threonine 3-dehydrogenase